MTTSVASPPSSPASHAPFGLLRGALFGGYTVVAVALPPGTPIDPQGPLGTVLTMAHPRLIVVTNAPGGTARRRRCATPAHSRPTTRKRPAR